MEDLTVPTLAKEKFDNTKLWVNQVVKSAGNDWNLVYDTVTKGLYGATPEEQERIMEYLKSQEIKAKDYPQLNTEMRQQFYVPAETEELPTSVTEQLKGNKDTHLQNDLFVLHNEQMEHELQQSEAADDPLHVKRFDIANSNYDTAQKQHKQQFLQPLLDLRLKALDPQDKEQLIRNMYDGENTLTPDWHIQQAVDRDFKDPLRGKRI